MTTTVTTTIRGHVLAISRLTGGWLQVGLDQRLVGCFANSDTALFEAAEALRQRTGWGLRAPTIPAAYRRRVDAIATG